MTTTELIEQILCLPENSAELRRYRRAQAMFKHLVSRGAWFGCRDWDGLDPLVQAAFMDMVALYAGTMDDPA